MGTFQKMRDPMPRKGCSSVGVAHICAWRHPTRSSDQEDAEPDAFWQQVCRTMMLGHTKVTKKDECIKGQEANLRERQVSSPQPRSRKGRRRKPRWRTRTQTSRSSWRPLPEVLSFSPRQETSYSKITISSLPRTEREQFRVRLTHSCQKSIGPTHPCSLTLCSCCSLPRDGKKTKHRWTKCRQKDDSNTSTGINDRFLHCEFNVNRGFTSVQLLAKIKHHVSSTVDDFGQECTPETYCHRIIFTSSMKE